MWKLVLCDDEPRACRAIQKEIERIETVSGEAFDITVFHSAETLLEKMPEDTDILLLDIKMGDLSGVDAARALRVRNNQVCIIFITSMTQFAMEGYEVHAFGFIQKPVDGAQLEHFLLDAVKGLKKRKANRLLFRCDGQPTYFDPDDILCFEAFRHDIDMRTTVGTYHPAASLSELERDLSDLPFFRCHKSFLVNLRHVRSFSTDRIVLTDGSEVFLSKHRRRAFLEAFGRFAGGGTV